MNIRNNPTDNDIIKMEIETSLKDKNGNIIEIKVPKPEYRPEIFSLENFR